jgi:hypothetical protein
VKLIKKTTDAEGIQFIGGPASAQEVLDWVTEHGGEAWHIPAEIPGGAESGRVEIPEHIDIMTPVGMIRAEPSWWVLHTDRDGFYTRTAADVDATYERHPEEG